MQREKHWAPATARNHWVRVIQFKADESASKALLAMQRHTFKRHIPDHPDLACTADAAGLLNTAVQCHTHLLPLAC